MQLECKGLVGDGAFGLAGQGFQLGDEAGEVVGGVALGRRKTVHRGCKVRLEGGLFHLPGDGGQLGGQAHQIALILKSTPLGALQQLGEHNEVMPQKSTYFYPKVATGMVINPLE